LIRFALQLLRRLAANKAAQSTATRTQISRAALRPTCILLLSYYDVQRGVLSELTRKFPSADLRVRLRILENLNALRCGLLLVRIVGGGLIILQWLCTLLPLLQSIALLVD
jgi:hypothetical protein